jgi:SOS-response transcriptional repressor LexA/DNA-binding XRE family transcriptional regulator
MQFGKYLKSIRFDKGFKTQKELSDASEISQATLSRIEAGIQKPQPETLKVLALVLNIPYSSLLREAGYLSSSDESLSESEITHREELKTKVILITILKKIADKEGYFPSKLHKRLFKIFFDGLLLLDSRFDEWFYYDYLNVDDCEADHERAIEGFNKTYNCKTIEDELFRDDYVDIKPLRDFPYLLDELEKIRKSENQKTNNYSEDMIKHIFIQYLSVNPTFPKQVIIASELEGLDPTMDPEIIYDLLTADQKLYFIQTASQLRSEESVVSFKEWITNIEINRAEEDYEEDILEGYDPENEPWIKTYPTEKTYLPVVSKIGIMEDSLENSKYVVDQISIDNSKLDDKYAIGYLVQDDSMIGDGIYKGDIVIATSEPGGTTPDEIAIININDNSETLIRRVEIQNDLYILTSSNPKFKTLVLPRNLVYTIGKVIELRRKFQ